MKVYLIAIFNTIFFSKHLSFLTLGPFIVAGPLATLTNWVNEFKKWLPSCPVVLYHGSKLEREEIRCVTATFQCLLLFSLHLPPPILFYIILSCHWIFLFFKYLHIYSLTIDTISVTSSVTYLLSFPPFLLSSFPSSLPPSPHSSSFTQSEAYEGCR